MIKLILKHVCVSERFHLIHITEEMPIHGNYQTNTTVHYGRGLLKRLHCDQERLIDVVGLIFMLLDKYI